MTPLHAVESADPLGFHPARQLVATCLVLAPALLSPLAAAAQSAGDLPVLDKRLQEAFASLEELDGVLGAPFEPAAVARSLGRDPAGALAWVRANTTWVPYHGSLKGPSGVLRDQQGNSLDRSRLLAELLRTWGVGTRLAHAEVDGERLARIRPNSTAEPARRPASSLSSELVARAKDAARRLGETVSRGGARAPAGKPTPARVDPASVAKQSAHLVATLRAKGLLVETSAEEDEPLRDHWWVQYRAADGKWMDLDPMLTAGASGRIADPDRTVEVGALDEADLHRVKITVVVERTDGGQPWEEEILSRTVVVPDLDGRAILLAHYGVPGTARAQKRAKQEAAALGQVWAPYLCVMEDCVPGRGFSLLGEPAAPQAAAQGASDIGGILSGGLSPPERSPGDTSTTAEWVDIEILAPGGELRKIRREIFDLVGPAARLAGEISRPPDKAFCAALAALHGEMNLLVLSSKPSPESFIHEAAKEALRTRDAWLAAAREPEVARRVDILRRLPKSQMLPGLALFAWGRHAGAGTAGGRVLLDSANVIALVVRSSPKECGPATTRAAVDLADNHVGIRGGPDVTALRIAQGVADTAAEALALPPSPGRLVNVFHLFAGLGDAKTVLIDGGTDVAGTLPGLSPDVAARIASAVGDGLVLVASARPMSIGRSARYGWWQVNPSTGDTVGVMDDGGRQVMTEDTTVRRMPAAHGEVNIHDFERWLASRPPETQALIRSRPDWNFWANDWRWIFEQLGVRANMTNMELCSDLLTMMGFATGWLLPL